MSCWFLDKTWFKQENMTPMTTEMQNSGDMILKLLKTFTARVLSRLRIFALRDDVFKLD